MSNNVVPGWFLRKSLRCLCLCEHCELCSMNKSAQPLSGRRESRKNPPGKPPGIYHHPLTMSAMSLQRLQDSSPLLKSCWRWCSLRVKRWTTFVDYSDPTPTRNPDNWSGISHSGVICLPSAFWSSLTSQLFAATWNSYPSPRSHQHSVPSTLRINTSNSHPHSPSLDRNKAKQVISIEGGSLDGFAVWCEHPLRSCGK